MQRDISHQPYGNDVIKICQEQRKQRQYQHPSDTLLKCDIASISSAYLIFVNKSVVVYD